MAVQSLSSMTPLEDDPNAPNKGKTPSTVAPTATAGVQPLALPATQPTDTTNIGDPAKAPMALPAAVPPAPTGGNLQALPGTTNIGDPAKQALPTVGTPLAQAPAQSGGYNATGAPLDQVGQPVDWKGMGYGSEQAWSDAGGMTPWALAHGGTPVDDGNHGQVPGSAAAQVAKLGTVGPDGAFTLRPGSSLDDYYKIGGPQARTLTGGALTKPDGTAFDTSLLPPELSGPSVPANGPSVPRGTEQVPLSTSPTGPSTPSPAGSTVSGSTGQGALATALGVPASSGTYANTGGITAGGAGDLTNQLITPGETTDRMQLANQYLKNWNDSTNPQFQADLRDALRSAAAGGAIGSGQLQSRIGDVVSNRDTQRNAAEGNFLTSAQGSSIDDAFKKLDELKQQQQYQAGRSDTAFNQGLASENAGYTQNPADILAQLAKIYGGQAASSAAGVGDVAKGSAASGAGSIPPWLQAFLSP